MITIIENKRTDYCIAVSQYASIVEEKAAEELAYYIEKSCGVKLSVQKENVIKGQAIYIGHTEYAGKNNVMGDSVENWMISVCGQDVILTGGLTNQDRGIPYAVYHFLEEIVGIRWWSWFEEYIPSQSALCIAEDFHKSGTPVFEYREIYDSIEKVNLSYMAHNRLNARVECRFEEGTGHPEYTSRGGVMYAGRPYHTHTLPLMVPIDKYYDEHPEWFAYNELSKDRPKTGQHGTLYCLTNEGLIRFTAEKVMENIEIDMREAREKGLELPAYYSVSMADAQNYCKCEKCKQVHEKSGKTGYNLQFVNAVAKLVAEKYPEVWIETLVYWDYIEPPKDDTMPAENVLIRLADLKIDLLRDVEAPTNTEEMRLLKTWGSLCKKNNTKVYVWDYFLQQYPNCMMPYFLKFSKNFKYFYENQVRGCFVEHEVTHPSDFWTMTQWLLTRMMEDPYQDFDALVEDFTDRYYGEAAPYIREYIHLLEKNLADNACRIMVFEQAMISNYVSYETIKEGIRILHQAEEVVKNDQLRLSRIHTVMSCLYRTLVLRYEEFQTIAKKYHETLPITKQDASDLVIAYLQENAHVYARSADGQEYNKHALAAVEREIAFMKRYLDQPKICVPIPEDLVKYGAENVYTFAGAAFLGLAGCGMLPDGHQMGESIEWSYEVGHEVLKIAPQEMSVGRKYTYLAGKKEDSIPNPLKFYTEGYSENVTLELFQEDLYQEQYHLYHVGEVSGVTAHTATMLRLFAYLGYCVGISNLYEVFPADTYSIYINFKVSGNGYGGNPEKEDAVYIDAVHIVKKS